MLPDTSIARITVLVCDGKVITAEGLAAAKINADHCQQKKRRRNMPPPTARAFHGFTHHAQRGIPQSDLPFTLQHPPVKPEQ
jgi:hypothetical protein